GEQVGLRHDVARAALDSLRVHADRLGYPHAAVRRRSLQPDHRPRRPLRPQVGRPQVSPMTQGAIVLIVTLIILLSGAPVAFGLGAIAIGFLVIFQGLSALHVVGETLFSSLHDFTLVSIPMFVMMGAAIGSSPAGKDLYEALDRWLYRVPGGLVI